MSFNFSRVDRTGKDFSNLPRLINQGGLTAHGLGENPEWEVGASGRYVSRTESAFGKYASDYAAFDLWGDYRFAKELQIQARIDNLTDRKYEVISGYPHLGRAYTLAVQGSF